MESGEERAITKQAAVFVSAKKQRANPKKQKAVAVMTALGAFGNKAASTATDTSATTTLATAATSTNSSPSAALTKSPPPPQSTLPPSLAGLAFTFGSSAAAEHFVARMHNVSAAVSTVESNSTADRLSVTQRALKRRRQYRLLFRTNAAQLDEVVLTSPSTVTARMTMKQALKDIAREDFVLNGSVFSAEDEAEELEFLVNEGRPPPPPMTYQSPRRATERFLRTVAQLLTQFVEARRRRAKIDSGPGVVARVGAHGAEQKEHDECQAEHEECMRRICFACSRTLSGGDTYEAVATLFGGGVLVTPWSAGDGGDTQQNLPVEVEISLLGFAKVVTKSMFEVRSWESIDGEDGSAGSGAAELHLLVMATLRERLDFDSGGVFDECRRTLTLELTDSASSAASPARSPADRPYAEHKQPSTAHIGMHWPSFRLFGGGSPQATSN
jgi:hypothetical protein